MINQPEEQRLTPAQLNERVETIIFGNIVNPINNVCSITQDSFEDTQQVARIRHCGHIFNSDSLAHWLRMNNTCPTCRHNLLTDHINSSSAPNAAAPNAPPYESNERAPVRRIQIPLESEININTFYTELLRNSVNIPGFELNSMNDDSIIFSFDLMGARGSGPGPGRPGPGPGPGNVDDVD